MTTMEANPQATEFVGNTPAGLAGWLAATLDWVGERLNPILVKETRQALKSRQFIGTFTLVLACGWLWTMFGVASIGPHIHYGAEGAEMFFGYYIILAFPLLVVVPFGAFRSLSGEREDGTYELLCITTLRPRQIVGGKLASAVVQMLVYFSALAPNLAFTYILRGIDVPTIATILVGTFLASLALSTIGVLVGTATTQKHWQVILSVVMVAGLLSQFGSAIGIVGSLLDFGERIPFRESEFWLGCGALLTAYVSYLVLFFLAAAAQLSFASDNRSSALRKTMVVQQVLFTGWLSWPFLAFAVQDRFTPVIASVYCLGLVIHWYVMGVFMVGETGELSQRVKRQLPQSFLGRSFLTWFNPGAATGYVFALTNLAAGILLGWVAVWAAEEWAPPQGVGFRGRPQFSFESLLSLGVLGFCYVAMYLGLGRLFLGLVARYTPVTKLFSILVQVLLLLAGCGLPLTVHLMTDMRNQYSLLEMTNPFWTLGEIMEWRNLGAELPVLLFCLPVAAGVVILLNLRAVVREVARVRIAQPARVAEEDAALEAVLHPPVKVKLNPWDE